MNYAKWIEHFTRNKQNRPEPDWSAPANISPGVLAPMLRSVEQFRLGDGGGPASLIAFNRENFRSRTNEMRQIVDLWFAEEAEHARLLGCAVQRFGGRIITSHWSFTAFCLCWRVWILNLIGIAFALYIFMADSIAAAHHNLDAIRTILPERFDWPLFCIALVLMSAPAIQIGHRLFMRRQAELEAAEVTEKI